MCIYALYKFDINQNNVAFIELDMCNDDCRIKMLPISPSFRSAQCVEAQLAIISEMS